jgi:uncharacterized protein YkwD
VALGLICRFIDVNLKPRHIPRKRLAFTLVVFTLLAVALVMYYGRHGDEPRETDYMLHSVALEQVNNYRRSHDLALLDYDADLVAQEHAWRMMNRGELYHNPDLPSSMVESIAVYTENEIDPEVAIALMVDEMMKEDVDRENFLSPVFSEVSVGVAVGGDCVWLVFCFS